MVTPFQQGNRSGRFVQAIAACLLVITLAVSSVTAAEVEAALDREAVPAGNGAVLSVTVSGGNAGKPVIPPVDKLIVQPRGSSQRVEMFNGTTSVSTTYNYVVGSNTPGDYVIPALTVTVDGQQYSTSPLKLKVLDAGAAQPPPGMQQGGAGNSQPAEPQQEEEGEKRFGFLTVDLADSERKHAYVGEIAPVRIRAWLPVDSRAQLRSGIQPEGKAFTLHNVSTQPQQTQETRDGKRYLVVTWYGGISATKAGKYPASLSLDATVAVRDPSAPKRRTGGPFNDPFLDSMFDNVNVPMIQKDVTLKSDDQEIEVRPLPTEGRPAGFTGAVGKFKLDAYQIPSGWKTGEPQQITAHINGAGNFSLVNEPDLTPSGGWKTYPGKSDFTPNDATSFSGTKSFRFSAVPRKGGKQDASLTFSYFDPDAASYQTLTTPAQAIQVTGEDMVEDQVPAPAPEPEKKIEKKSTGLVGQHAKRMPAATLVPLVSRPGFVPLLGGSVLLMLLGPGLAWLRVRRSDPQRLARATMEKALREALETAGKCAATGDVAGFFAAARLAIQQRLGALWNQPAQAITSAEVQSRIPADSPVARFFQEADRHEYSRQADGGIAPQWRTLLDEAMASLTLSAR